MTEQPFGFNPKKKAEQDRDNLDSLLNDAFYKEALAAYDALKDSNLFDKENNMWNWCYNIAPEQEHLFTDKFAYDQLLGMIALGSMRRTKEARKIYNDLEEKRVFFWEKGYWYHRIDRTGKVEKKFNSDDILLDIIFLAGLGNIDSAYEKLEYLHNTSLLFDKDMWNDHHCFEKGVVDARKNSHTQLLGVIAFVKLNVKKKAEERYKSLLNTVLFDKKEILWRPSMKNKDDYVKKGKNVFDQLVWVWTLQSFNKFKEAKELYGRLKTMFYDDENKKWDTTVDDRNYFINRITTAYELLDVIIKANFAGK